MPVEKPYAVVVGGANVDFKARSDRRATAHTSNPGRAAIGPGGVGRNIAENIARLGTRVHLVSSVGSDSLGDDLLRHTASAGVDVDHVLRCGSPTGTYTAVLDVDGELIIAISDMAAASELGPQHLATARDDIAHADLVILDGNLSIESVDYVLGMSDGPKVLLDPVSVAKAGRLRSCVDERMYGVTPNQDELAAITGLETGTDRQVRNAAQALHDDGVELVWVRLGARGSLLSTARSAIEIPAFATEVVDVTGAGDAMLGAFCHGLIQGATPVEAARYGQAAASLTVASPETVRSDLDTGLIQAFLQQS